ERWAKVAKKRNSQAWCRECRSRRADDRGGADRDATALRSRGSMRGTFIWASKSITSEQRPQEGDQSRAEHERDPDHEGRACEHRGVGQTRHRRSYTPRVVTTKSMRPSVKASMHSAGVLTIGSSWTLKLVLTSTGNPVKPSKDARMS